MSWIKNFLLVTISICLTIASIELSLTFLEDDSHGFKEIIQYHETLGWAPVANAQDTDRRGNTATILSDGTRSGGRSDSKNGLNPILAVGDSFVFGSEVNDHESWPSQLEKLLGLKVVNAGVSGYGIDQTFLYAEELIKKMKPSMLIFGFFPDDIIRSAMSRRIANKPYFELNEESTILKNVPVPKNNLFEKILVKSRIVKRIFPGYEVAFAHDEYEHVSALLLKRISEIAREEGVPILFVVQYNDLGYETYKMVERVLFYVKNDGYSKILNFYYPLLKIQRSSNDEYNSLFINHIFKGKLMIRHMNPSGNFYTARSISDYLLKERQHFGLSVPLLDQ